MTYAIARRRGSNGEANKLYPEDRPVHEWYRFVLSFPPHLVREYLERWGMGSAQRVLDPFCGTGTVLVEAKKHGIQSVGVEANALAYYASKVKVDWSPDPDSLLAHATKVYDEAAAQLSLEGISDEPILDTSLFSPLQDRKAVLRTLPSEQMALLLADSISSLPLHKALVLLECIERLHDPRYYDHERLAFAKAIVFSSSNLHFGPEVGVGRPKQDAAVLAPWFGNMQSMANDLRVISLQANTHAEARHADARNLLDVLAPRSVDAVFTSPPYPNEKDYTRTTRLETVLLGFIRSRAELQGMKRNLLRSNTRNVYKGDEDEWNVRLNPRIQHIAESIEARRVELEKTSGFERLYPVVTKHYFGGMARHLADLRTVLRPGAHLGYVVGDQASYLRIMIPTGQLLAEIGEMLGYKVVGIDLFRTRYATATKTQLKEEVVVFQWPGSQEEIRHVYSNLPLGSIGVESNNDFALLSKEDRSKCLTNGRTYMGTSDSPKNRYQQIMERIFFAHYKAGSHEVNFDREELATAARELGINVPLNLGDIVYSFRYRQELPESIRNTAPEGESWIIQSMGRSQYQFKLREVLDLAPAHGLMQIEVPDATPGIINMYAQGDEQALLAKLRYNRLIDVFTGVTCYSLQNHLRTTIPNVGQVETDEVYVGVDRRGAHYVFPVQAKGGRDKMSVVQIEQDFALCEDHFKGLICRPIAAQFMANDVIALKAFDRQNEATRVVLEKHYRLVPPEQVSSEDLAAYRNHPVESFE